MALNKVEGAKLGKFGSLTSSTKTKQDKSIFGNNVCNTLCSFKDSFKDLSIRDNSTFDIFSPKGLANLEREKSIMQCKDSAMSSPKNFELNMKSFSILQSELNNSNNGKHVRFNS